MKIKSLIIGGIGCLGLLAVSCSDDNEAKYTPAPAQEIAAAYFSNSDNNLSFEIDDPDATTVTVSIYRNDASEEYTANLAIVSDQDLISAPSTVTFGVNEKTATIPLTFSTDALGAAIPHDYSLSITGTDDCPYYLGTINGVITFVPWMKVADVTFTDDFIASIFVGQPYYSMEVEIQEHPTIPGFYRLVNPYAQYPDTPDLTYDYDNVYYMFIHAEDPSNVWIPAFDTGLDYDGYGMISVTSLAGYAMEELGMDLSELTSYTGKLENGILKFPNNSFYTAIADYNGGDWTWYGNSSGKFRVAWPMEGPEWEEVGEAQYTDGLIPPLFFDEEPYTYPVMIEHSVIDEGLYRMVNPYKAGICPYGTEYDGDQYIEIDATNPDCLVVSLQATGLVDEELGTIAITNYAYVLKMNGYADDVIIGAGLNDTFADGVFTFGKAYDEEIGGECSNLMICFPETDQDMNLYFSTEGSSITLPGASLSMPARHYVANGASIIKSNLKSHVRSDISMPKMHKKVAKRK